MDMPSLDKKRKFKPKVLCWADLTLQNVDEILQSSSTEEIQSILIDIFKMKDPQEDMQSGILLDLYYYSIQFSKDKEFTKEQLSAFFSIVKSIHEMAVGTRPPFSIALFSTDQIKLITTYIVNTYFRHYKLYKYAFTPKVRLDLAIEYVGVPETPPATEDEEEAEEGEDGYEEKENEEATLDGAAQAEVETDDSPAVKELKAMISTVLQEQVDQLKTSVDLQIKAKDEEISKKMGISLDSTASPKSPKGKGKKGK